MNVLYCFTLSWNLCSGWLVLIKDVILNSDIINVWLIFKYNTQVYSWKKIAVGKKFVAVKVSTKRVGESEIGGTLHF